jgi:hypothetical protein
MLTFQENINLKEEGTNDTHVHGANIVVLLVVCLRILKQNAADRRVQIAHSMNMVIYLSLNILLYFLFNFCFQQTERVQLSKMFLKLVK